MIISPYQLQFLIHCHSNPGEWEGAGSRAHLETLEFLMANEIIKDAPLSDRRFFLTDKGVAWLFAILNTPFPVLKWVDQNGEIIKMPFEK